MGPGRAMITDEHLSRLEDLIAPLRVACGAAVELPHGFDPGHRPSDLRKKHGVKLMRRDTRALGDLQDRLAAQGTCGVLVVLQALDAAGKDGTIRHVMTGINPQGVEVHGFKVPTEEELAHDYLWRYM